jgi:DNA-binding SARP family transcriptional activator
VEARVLPSEESAGLRVSLTGPVGIHAPGVAPDERRLGGRQARLLLALLVVSRDRPLHREEIAQRLWGDRPPDAWDSALRSLVSRVRCVLGEAGLAPAEALRNAFGCYQLHLPAGATVDLDLLPRAVETAERALDAGDPRRAAAAAARACELATRPVLPGEEAPWLERLREERQGWHLRALDALAEAGLRGGDGRSAVESAEAAVALEPLREAGYALLMRAQAAMGNRGEALRVYERLCRLLSEELGVDPSPELRAVHLEVLRAGREQPRGPRPAAPPVPGPDAAALARLAIDAALSYTHVVKKCQCEPPAPAPLSPGAPTIVADAPCPASPPPRSGRRWSQR